MEIRATDILDVMVITPRRFYDEGGFFAMTYSRRQFQDHGLAFGVVQDNLSLSARPGTVRGPHFQRPPFAQDNQRWR